MAIPLFWRLNLGYAAILLLSLGTSVYSIVQLGALSSTARAVIDADSRTIAYQETLTDAFLSEVRYGGKYLITQSPASYDQQRQFENDFIRYLGQLKASGTSDAIMTQLARVERLHQGYHELFAKEVHYLKSGQPYAQSRYQQERNKFLDNTLTELARLKGQLQKNVHYKLEHMSGSARAARQIAIVSSLILLVLGTVLSLKMSTDITGPLQELRRQSQQQSADSQSTVRLSRVVEIQELADAWAREKRRLQEAADNNANLVEQVTDDLASRLISFKRQLNQWQLECQSAIQGKEFSIDTLLSDTDRLIQHCGELHASAAARSEVSKLRPLTGQPAMIAPMASDKTNGQSDERADSFPFRLIKGQRITEWCTK